jgi:hypothetical protein
MHTAGPWVVVGEYVEAHDLDTPLSICTLADCGDATQSNGRLITAATDLLVALEHLVFDCEAHGLTDNDAHLREARAAIAKAKGE